MDRLGRIIYIGKLQNPQNNNNILNFVVYRNSDDNLNYCLQYAYDPHVEKSIGSINANFFLPLDYRELQNNVVAGGADIKGTFDEYLKSSDKYIFTESKRF